MNRRIIDVNDLIDHLKNQDPRAQTRLYNLYSPYLFSICRKLLDNVEDCNDLISQAFSKIFLNIKKAEFPSEFAFKGWMKKILINEALYLIKKQRQRVKQENISLYSGIAEPTIENDLNYSDLFHFMDSLPQGYRRVFFLHQIEGYTHKEIARMLHIDEGTSKSQFHKARLVLQDIINRNDNLHENTRR